MREVVIIGGGHNGLVTATLLAKAGLKPLVLERAERLGGCAITSDIGPGFRCSTLSHRAAIDPAIVRGLNLVRHGLEIVPGDALTCSPTLDGRALTLWADAQRAAGDIAVFSTRDASRYAECLASVAAVAAVLRRLISAPAPRIDSPSAADLLALLGAGRRFRALGRTNAYRLLRWLPMPVADFVGEWFESEPLRAVIAAGGLLGSFLGPRSAGSTAILLLLAARAGHLIDPGWTCRGGIGAVADALAAAAREAGAELRTGVEVRHILVGDEGAHGVALATGEEIQARHVVSNVDPIRTLLGLIDPIHLAPDFLNAARNIRVRGAMAKVNFAVSALPRFAGLRGLGDNDQAAAMSGCMRLAPDLDSIERAFDAAKYGRFSDRPWIELTIPSILDPALAPSGQHVVSAYVQFTPFELRESTWDAERDRLGTIVGREIDNYAPGFERSIVARQTITPHDLERQFGLTGGHIFHGELAIDQLLAARPLLGWSRYGTPIPNLYLCGSGVHPGTGLDGRTGALAAREILKTIRG
ncbi:MAG: NAD(P)-binding protein [Luteitalea sp.]|nr:NAD(P)-binding protein [Luteitalea sp.]